MDPGTSIEALSIRQVAALTSIVGPCITIAVMDTRKVQKALLLFVTGMILFAIGEMQTFETIATLPENKNRGAFIDDIFSLHFSMIPVIFAMDQTVHSVMFISIVCMMAAAITLAFGLVVRDSHVNEALFGSSRGVVLGLYAMAYATLRSGPALNAAIASCEVAYVSVLQVFKPLGGGRIAGLDGALETANELVRPDADDDEQTPENTCSHLCVKGSGQDACFKHNKEVRRVHQLVANNKAARLPQYHSMTAKERKCHRLHGVGEKCSFCAGHGCVSRRIKGVVCTSSEEEMAQELSRIKSVSDRNVEDGFGVLTMSEQLEQAQGFTSIG